MFSDGHSIAHFWDIEKGHHIGLERPPSSSWALILKSSVITALQCYLDGCVKPAVCWCVRLQLELLILSCPRFCLAMNQCKNPLGTWMGTEARGAQVGDHSGRPSSLLASLKPGVGSSAGNVPLTSQKAEPGQKNSRTLAENKARIKKPSLPGSNISHMKGPAGEVQLQCKVQAVLF